MTDRSLPEAARQAGSRCRHPLRTFAPASAGEVKRPDNTVRWCRVSRQLSPRPSPSDCPRHRRRRCSADARRIRPLLFHREALRRRALLCRNLAPQTHLGGTRRVQARIERWRRRGAECRRVFAARLIRHCTRARARGRSTDPRPPSCHRRVGAARRRPSSALGRATSKTAAFASEVPRPTSGCGDLPGAGAAETRQHPPWPAAPRSPSSCSR